MSSGCATCLDNGPHRAVRISDLAADPSMSSNIPADPDDSPPGEPAREAAPHRPIKSFVLRAGRMGSGQVRAMNEWGPIYTVPYTAGLLNAPRTFGRTAPLVFEIGFGMVTPRQRSRPRCRTPTSSASRCTRRVSARCSS